MELALDRAQWRTLLSVVLKVAVLLAERNKFWGFQGSGCSDCGRLACDTA
jgi:hypothetical protein